MRCAWLLGLAVLHGCSDGPRQGLLGDDAALAAADAIDAAGIRGVVLEIADDGYGGRAPGTAGDRMTRAYLSERLAELGFEPGAGQGRWDQPFALIGLNSRQPASWSFAADGEDLTLAQYQEFIVASGVQAPRVAVADRELVFVGYGIQAPEFDWDDYKGVDLNGKVLVMLNNDPDWDPALFAGPERLYYGRW
jgi:hypothetical protein